MIWVILKEKVYINIPAALDDPKLATGDEYDVSFFRLSHRHIPSIQWCALKCSHDDRDIEFIPSKRWLEKLYSGSETGGVLVLDYKSCEMICDELAETINKNIRRRMEITVSEDGENGATIKYGK